MRWGSLVVLGIFMGEGSLMGMQRRQNTRRRLGAVGGPRAGSARQSLPMTGSNCATLGLEMADWKNPTLCLTRCPRCAFDLSALPRRHRCPECGYAYDESMFMLEGFRLPDFRTWVRSAVLSGPVAIFVLSFLRIGLGWSWRVIFVILAGLLSAVVLLYLYARRRDRWGRRVLVRYLITQDGVARPGKHVYLWSNYSHVLLLPGGGGGWRLHLYPSWWRLLGPPIVDARLECSDAEAQAVGDEIQRRINVARTTEAEAAAGKQDRRWS